MPEDTKAADTTAADLIKNTKAEMDRKLGNVESTISQLAETNKALAAQLAALNKPKPAETPARKSYGEMFYDDENATLTQVEQNATNRAVEVMSKLNQTETKRQQIIGQMVNEYPELMDANTDLRKKAVENFNSLSKEEQADPQAYKVAVRDAAADLGLLPKSKRKAEDAVADKEEENEDDDSFTLNKSGGDAQAARKADRRKKDDGKISQETLLFAELLGRPVDDEKYKERLAKAAKRTNWSKYRKV